MSSIVSHFYTGDLELCYGIGGGGEVKNAARGEKTHLFKNITMNFLLLEPIMLFFFNESFTQCVLICPTVFPRRGQWCCNQKLSG